MANKKNSEPVIPSVWDREPESEMFWSEIQPDNDKEYLIMILNINDYNVKTVGDKGNYIIFGTKLLKGFETQCFNNDCLIRFHFPLHSFTNSITKAKGFRRIIPSENKDALVLFKRPTQRTIEFLEITYLDMPVPVPGMEKLPPLLPQGSK